MGLIVTTPAAAEPLSLADAKRHCRIASDETREDPELQGWIAAARLEAERISGRVLAARTLRYTFDSFPDWEIELPVAPLVSVASVKYVDTDGVLTTIDAADYSAITTREPAIIEPSYDAGCWPLARSQSDACQVNFVAGYPVTTIAAAIAAGSQTVTPASMAGIIADSVLTIDIGSRQEQVVVTAVTSTTFTAVFGQAHSQPPTVINCVPGDLRAALLLLVGHKYRYRDEDVPPPQAVLSLLRGNWTGSYLGPS